MSSPRDSVGTAAPEATPGISFDPEAARAWLVSQDPEEGSPDPEEPGLTVASVIGVSDEDMFGPGMLDFASCLEELVEKASAAGLFGAGWSVALWLTYDPSMGNDGGLVTVDLPGSSVRLAGLHVELKHLSADRESSGVAAAVAVLSAIAGEATSIVAGWSKAKWARAEPAGYIVAGEEGGRLVENWDAEVHLTIDAGRRSLVECRAAGYTGWKLYAMTEVATDPGSPA